MVAAIDSRFMAEETIRRLGLGVEPDELLDDLRVQPEAGTTFFD